MDKKQTELKKVNVLRQKAEKLPPAKGTGKTAFKGDAQKWIRELQAQMKELEKQNEKLHRARLKIKESRNKYTDLYAFAPTGYFSFDEKGKIQEVNLTGARILGADRKALLNRSFSPFVTPEKWNLFQSHLSRVIATGTRDGCELQLLKKNGTLFDASLESIAVHDREGKLTHCRSAITNITERKQSEDALRESESRFRLALKHAPLSITFQDRDLRFISVYNPHSGSTVSEFIGKTEADLYPPEEAARLMTLKGKVIETGREAREQLWLTQQQGKRVFVDVFVEPIKDETGRLVGVETAALDFTERKEMEEFSKALNEINLVINSTLDFDEIMRRVIKDSSKAMACETASISLRKGALWIVSYLYGLPRELAGTQMNDEEEPHAVLAMKTKKIVVINDAYNDQRVNRQRMKKFGVRSVLVVPLVVRDEAVGAVFYNYHSSAISFRKNQIDFAEKLGASVTLALENARLFQELRQSGEALRKSRDELGIRVGERTKNLNKRIKEMNCLYSISSILSEHDIPLKNVLQELVELIPSAYHFPENVGARIILKEEEFKTRNFQKTVWMQSNGIFLMDKPVGAVEVSFLQENPPGDEGPFLKEERALMDLIAEQLGEFLKHRQAEKTVMDQSRILDGFFNSSITPLVILDRDFNFVRVNQAYAKACQREIAEFMGHNHFEFYPHQENEAIFKQVVEEKIPFQAVAKPFIFPDHPDWGTTYWDWKLTPLLDDRGEVEFLVFSLEDITDRKRAEDTAKAENAFRKAIEDSVFAGIITFDLDGRQKFVNPAFCNMIGWTEDELVGGKPPFVYWPLEDRETNNKIFQEIIFGQRDPGRIELRFQRKNGKIFDVSLFPSPLKYDQGKLIGWIASIIDITDRKENERRTQASNALHKFFIKKFSRKEYLDEVVEQVRKWSGCRCAGIRLLDEKGNIPYESHVGFSRDFWESENLLSVKEDHCVCPRVVTGKPDPLESPFITPKGSFVCENVVQFISGLSVEEQTRFRRGCFRNKFKSMAIVPLYHQDVICGAVQLADKKEGKVSFPIVEFIESMAPLIGEAIHRLNLEDKIRESEKKLKYLSSQLLASQENERKFIAQELHDSIQQTLAAIKFTLERKISEMGKGKTPPPGILLEDILLMMKNCIEETRRIMTNLRPSVLDDLGILATLSWFFREFQKAYPHIQIDQQVEVQENDVPDQFKTVIFRILQEAMSNIAKHSQGESAWVVLRKMGNAIELLIKDKGIGFDPGKSPRGLGLASMKERAELSGGTLAIESFQGEGTVVRAKWEI